MPMKEQGIQALRARFNSHLPQYDVLWRSMLTKRKGETLKRREPHFLLTAIETKTTVTINAKRLYDEACEDCEDCAPPTFEEVIIDEASQCTPASQRTVIAFQDYCSSNDESDATQPTVIRINDCPSIVSHASTVSPDTNHSDAYNAISFDLSRMGIADQVQPRQLDANTFRFGETTLNSRDINEATDVYSGKKIEFSNMKTFTLSDCEADESQAQSANNACNASDVSMNLKAPLTCESDKGSPRSETLRDINDEEIKSESTTSSGSTVVRFEINHEAVEGTNDEVTESDDTDSSGSTVVRFDIPCWEKINDKESIYLTKKRDEIEELPAHTSKSSHTQGLLEIVPHTPIQVNNDAIVPSTPVNSKYLGKDEISEDLVDTPSPLLRRKIVSQMMEGGDLVDTPSPQPNVFKSRRSNKIWSESSGEDDDDETDESWLVPDTDEKGGTTKLEESSDEDLQWEDEADEFPEESISGDEEPDDFIVLSSDDGSDSDGLGSLGVAFTEMALRKPKSKSRATPVSFRRNRDALTKAAFEEFNMKIFAGSLTSVKIEWSKKLRTTGGITRLKRLIQAGKDPVHIASIDLSEKVLDEEHRMRSTLVHEMCHAAAWLVDRVSKPAHGRVFKKWGRLATKKTSIPVLTTHDYAIQYKFAWACQTLKCGAVIQRQSRSVDVAKQICSRCKGRLVEIEAPMKGISVSDMVRTPKKKAPLSGYNLFVKQMSSKVREQMNEKRILEGRADNIVTQPEVLRECARLWNERKNAEGTAP